MDGRKLTLTIERSGIESVRSYQIDQSEDVIFGPCLDDYLASLPESTDEAVVKTIEEAHHPQGEHDGDGDGDVLEESHRIKPTS